MENQPVQTLLSPSPELLKSLDTIHEFIKDYPPQEFEEHCWRLATLALSNEECDDWTHIARGDFMDMCRQFSGLGKALQTVDKELNYPKEEELID